MEAKKYLCNHCQELFDLLEPHNYHEARCPRCSSKDVEELTACSLESGPPPWEYVCQQCGGRFRVKAPRGPSEEKGIRCPRCESRNVRWSATVSEACPPGG
jgi:DNA-directed RNA polymerase subunit RPC12/RpoP